MSTGRRTKGSRARGYGGGTAARGGASHNHLAVKRATPEGELVQIWSIGSSDDWLCGDGPGPSLRSAGREPVRGCYT